jgi:hypothetical protein
MRNKFALTALSACAALMMMPAANAKTVCPFTDHFFIQAPLPLTILKQETEGNLAFTQMTPTYFRLSCSDIRDVRGGLAFVTIGMDQNIQCKLTIKDGPYEMNPTVTEVYCGGPGSKISYIGMDHPFASHDYTLKFSM